MLNFFTYLLIEVSNLLVLLCTNDTIDLISNFVAIVIVAEFDSYVYASMKDEPFKKLIEEEFTSEVLKICHTTSKKCKDDVVSCVNDPNGSVRPLKINWSDRVFENKFQRFIYCLIRWFYVSIYFYFFPFIGVITSIFIPIYY